MTNRTNPPATPLECAYRQVVAGLRNAIDQAGATHGVPPQDVRYMLARTFGNFTISDWMTALEIERHADTPPTV